MASNSGEREWRVIADGYSFFWGWWKCCKSDCSDDIVTLWICLKAIELYPLNGWTTLATWCEELTHLKRLWCWERLRARGEGDDRGWDGWITIQPSPTGDGWHHQLDGYEVEQAPEVGDGRGKLGMLQSIGSQRVGHDWATELNWISEQVKDILASFPKTLLSKI